MPAVRWMVPAALGVACGADATGLAGEGHEAVVAADATPCLGKTVPKDAVLQVFAKRLAHKGLRRVVVTLNPKLVITGHTWSSPSSQAMSRNARQWFVTAVCAWGGAGCSV